MKMGKKRVVAMLLVIALIGTFCPEQIMKVQAQTDTGKTYTFISDNGELEISLREVKDNENWYEYYITVSNHSSQSVCDWSVVLSCSNVSAYSKAFECSAKADLDAGTLTVKGTGNNKVVAAGSSASSGESFKLGFGSSVTFTSGTIAFSYGSQSSEEDSSGGVGYGNTYLDGYECKYNLTGEAKAMAFEDTPFGKHGKLHVNGTKLTDEHDQPVILRGASTHGMHWGEMTPFVNKAAFRNLRDEWGVDMVRLVSYVTQGGYTQGSQQLLDNCIQNGVSYADELGMYAIIDWHIHAENPNDNKDAALTFFDKYSEMYADHDNIIYEICNEPTGTPWSQIKPYAQEVVNTIRANDPDAIIVVGTNTWSQDVDEVATGGGKIDDPNVMYTIHFYSGSHSQSLRDKVETALNAGTPVFCTEFGICDASGNGAFDVDEANRWIDYFEEKGISYCCWSLCNKNESASMISPQCSKKSGWVNSDLGATGAWLVNTYRSKRQDTPDATAVPKPTAGTTESPETSDNPSTTQYPSGSADPSVTEKPSVGTGEVILAENLEKNESYIADGMDWFKNGADKDEIALVYTCTDTEHANWGIMGWGATVNGEWKEGLKYDAGSPATAIVTKTITLGELKDSLGVGEKEEVSGLQITVYNGGKIVSLSVKSVAAATETPGTSPLPTKSPSESSTPVSTPTGSPSVGIVTAEPASSMIPTAEPAEDQPVASTGKPSGSLDGDIKDTGVQMPGGNIGESGSGQWKEGVDDTVAIRANDAIVNRKIRAVWAGRKIKVRWSKVRNLSGCEIYIKKCGAKQSKQYLAGTVKGWKKNSFEITNIDGKKLKPSDVYEVTVKVYNFLPNGKKIYVAKGLVLHTVSNANKKFTNVKKVTPSVRKITLKKGKAKKIKAKLTGQNRKKKLLTVKHTKSLRYLSSNKCVATVDSKGRIKAVGKGTCVINVIALNGVNAEIEVKVK